MRTVGYNGLRWSTKVSGCKRNSKSNERHTKQLQVLRRRSGNEKSIQR